MKKSLPWEDGMPLPHPPPLGRSAASPRTPDIIDYPPPPHHEKKSTPKIVSTPSQEIVPGPCVFPRRCRICHEFIATYHPKPGKIRTCSSYEAALRKLGVATALHFLRKSSSHTFYENRPAWLIRNGFTWGCARSITLLMTLP